MLVRTRKSGWHVVVRGREGTSEQFLPRACEERRAPAAKATGAQCKGAFDALAALIIPGASETGVLLPPAGAANQQT